MNILEHSLHRILSPFVDSKVCLGGSETKTIIDLALLTVLFPRAYVHNGVSMPGERSDASLVLMIITSILTNPYHFQTRIPPPTRLGVCIPRILLQLVNPTCDLY